MREVHRVIADSVLLSDQFDAMAAKIVAKTAPTTGKTIAVVGGGPAGLTAAFYLALLGHEVTVFESHSEAGGMLRFALPEYRLPREVLDREIEIIRRLGVEFRLQLPHRHRYFAERSGSEVRCGVPLDRHLEGIGGPGAGQRTGRRLRRAAFPRGGGPRRARRTSASASSSSAAAMPPSIAPAR